MRSELQRRLPLLITAVIFLLLLAAGGVSFRYFFTAGNLVNLVAGNAAVGVIAVGMTLLIFAGGIDLSVGAVAGFSTIFFATMVMNHGIHPALAAMTVLLVGAAFGTVMGLIVQVFRQPPFLVTLAGMFFARGCAFWISTESVAIKNPFYQQFTDYTVKAGDRLVHPLPGLVLIGVLLAGYVVSQYTRFGRNLLAIGGSEQSAILMGLPVGPTKIAAYTLCGAMAALGGLMLTLNTSSGNSISGLGLELDAIAIVVIGGTLLTGGRGHMLGTFCGILIFGTIQLIITFGSLDSAWTRIIIGGLLLAFILFQRLLLRLTQKRLS